MFGFVVPAVVNQFKGLILGGLLLLSLIGAAFYLQHQILKRGYEQGLRECAEKQIQIVKEQEALRLKLSKEKDDEIAIINRRHRNQLNGLRNRPSRSDLSTTACPLPESSGSRGTGLELSREDAEFLAGEAAHAETLRQALKTCLNIK